MKESPIQKTDGPYMRLQAILADCARKAQRAAMSGKPTMWAYYIGIGRALRRWFHSKDDGGIAGQALALIQCAELRYGDRPDIAARWAAMAIYARKILRGWGVGAPRASNEWLHARALEGIIEFKRVEGAPCP